MFKDGISVPSLSEKMLYNIAHKGLAEFSKEKALEPSETISVDVMTELCKKIIGYMSQDNKAKHIKDSYDVKNYISIEQIKQLLKNHNYRCKYCWKELSEDFTLDRINNKKAHLHGNCVIACVDCNKAKGDGNLTTFKSEKCSERLHKFKKSQIFNII